MGENSKIAWTDNSFNPWIGCTKLTTGCKFCYGLRDTNLRGWKDKNGKVPWGNNVGRYFTKEGSWNKLKTWNNRAKRTGVKETVFVASLADIGDPHPEVHEARERFFQLTLEYTDLVFLLLTKRVDELLEQMFAFYGTSIIPENIWFGFSAENNELFHERLSKYFYSGMVFSTVFVSAEPLLGEIKFPKEELGELIRGGTRVWWIDGGESGASEARPVNLDWFRSHRDQCRDLGIDYFLKQMGSHWWRKQIMKPRGYSFFAPGWHGDEMELWPEDLRIQERPEL